MISQRDITELKIIWKIANKFFIYFVNNSFLCYNIFVNFKRGKTVINVLDGLSKEQREPASVVDGPVLVTAGAGSGKTRMLTHRIAHLVHDMHILPHNILAITFTNKAANEMKTRLESMLDSTDGMWICTFHSMCAKILRFEAEQIGFTSSFSIYSDTERDKILKKIVAETGTNLNVETIGYHISNAKNHLLLPESYGEFIPVKTKREQIVECYKKYLTELKQNNAMDFDDLLFNVCKLFRQNPDTLQYYQNKFVYIHIDEFQDTNTAQYELVKLLSGKYHNVFAVGDEDQCIYSWRGAEIGNVLSFTKDFPNAKVFKLEENYRSTKNILSLANCLIKKNFNRLDKNLFTKNDNGTKVEEFTAYSESEEAEYVAESIKSLVTYSNYNFRDIAVLMRVNSQSRALEEKMISYSIPYKVYGGYKFFERKEIKDVISYLRLLVNPFDNEATERVLSFPKKGIGDVTISSLEQIASENNISIFELINSPHIDIGKIRNKVNLVSDMFSDFLQKKSSLGLYDLAVYIIEKAKIKEALSGQSDEDISRQMNIDDFLVSVKEYEDANENPTLEDYLASVTLYRDIDEMNDSDNCVSLITVHSAKGLEFKVVFIVGLNEYLFPISRAIESDDENELEEERRLMYVAITRAKERLYFTRPRTKFSFDKKSIDYTVPSRFLRECKVVENEAIENKRITNRDEILKKAKDNIENFDDEEKPQVGLASTLTGVRKSDYSKFQKGTVVMHPNLGRGEVVLPVSDMLQGYVTIKFDSVGNKTLSLKFANLTIVDE